MITRGDLLLVAHGVPATLVFIYTPHKTWCVLNNFCCFQNSCKKIFLRLDKCLVNKVLHVAPQEKSREELNLAIMVAKELDQLDLSTFHRIFGRDFRGRHVKSARVLT